MCVCKTYCVLFIRFHAQIEDSIIFIAFRVFVTVFLHETLQLNFIVHLNFALLICLPTNRFLFVCLVVCLLFLR